MIISGRFWRKATVTAIAAIGFVSLYEVTALDSNYVARLATLRETSERPVPGARLAFSATAYCKGIVTASGVAAQTGVVEADPEMLPVGSVVDIESLPERYNGIYTVMDTGPSVHGREVDVYMWRAIGRRSRASGPINSWRTRQCSENHDGTSSRRRRSASTSSCVTGRSRSRFSRPSKSARELIPAFQQIRFQEILPGLTAI